METTETAIARKPEVAMPKIEGGEPPLAGKTGAATPGTEGREAPRESKPEAKPVTVTPAVGHTNNPPARKAPEAKGAAGPAKTEGGEGAVAPKPGAVTPGAEGTDNPQARRAEARAPRAGGELVLPETPLPSSPATPARVRSRRVPPAYARFMPEHEAAKVHLIEEQCRSFCLSLFFRESDPVRSLGITSSIPGEGKSFIAGMLAHVLSGDSARPVLLVECDWENTSYHDYFGIPLVPGLAEWLRGECAEADIRYQVSGTLSVIRAGDGQQDAVRLIQTILKRGLHNTLARNGENLVVDLPPVITSSCSVFAASMVDALALVVRAGVTPDTLVADACHYLSNLPVQGVILNQVEYRPGPYAAARKAP